VYNPLDITKDAARTWNPFYPNQHLLSDVKVIFSPVCDWPEVFDEATGKSRGFNRTSNCSLHENSDISVSLSMNYSIQYGILTEGMKSIADSPKPTSPVPWIHKVEDGNGKPLNYSLFRDSQSKEWFVHFKFADSNARTQSVHLEYQLRRVLTGRTDDSNMFVADWLQEWDAPVQSMDINWVFPEYYKPKKFSVLPDNYKEDGEPSQMTALCCGSKDVKEISKCTYDLKLGRRWASQSKSVNNCQNQSVVLMTSLRMASGLWADEDAGVKLKDVYTVSFSPGIVTVGQENVKDGESYMWILPFTLILLFPCLGAIFWMSQSPKPKNRHDA
jgi:hypothetical protein